MTQDQRREYSRMHIAQMNRFERKYLRRIYDALFSQVEPVVAILQERGPEAAKSQMERLLMNEQIGDVIQEMYADAGLFFARKTYREIQRSVRTLTKAIGFNEEWTAEILAFLRAHLLERAVWPITETSRSQIAHILDTGMAEGWTIEAMVAELKSRDLIAWRARLIARTELNIAAFAGRQAGENKSEYETQKEWIAANDHRTRHSHRLVDGEVVDFEARFQVQRRKGGVDMMEGPGDPEASAENVCNCRCTVATVAKRDHHGRLVPKTNIAIINPGAFNTPRQIIMI